MGTVQWWVDDRPPTWWARLYIRGMWWRRDKTAFEGARHTEQVARDKQAAGDAAPGRLTRLVARVGLTRPHGYDVWVARPRLRRPRARVVYLHGGGYVHPLTPDYWRLVRTLVRGGHEVVVPAYPLAPDAHADDVVPTLVDLVVERSESPLPTVLMGDSAGGALVLVVAGLLRPVAERVRLVGVVALCPWLDAALEEPGTAELEATDPMLAESGLRAAGRWWAGPRPVRDPLVSPLDGDLSGLPPVDVLIGDRDILRPGVERLAARAREQDVDLTVRERRAMFHVWMTRALPEAARTRRELRRLVSERAGG